MMQRQVRPLVRLVDDLLDVSRITRNRLELRREWVELGPIVADAVDACRPLALRGEVEIALEMPEAPIALHADAVRLAQVFGNLLTNACKSTRPGGCVRLAVEREGSDVVVSVHDNGKGIAPELQSRLFEPFATFGKAGGTGLGLAIVRQIVEAHGGQIRVESSPLGTLFVVEIPDARSGT